MKIQPSNRVNFGRIPLYRVNLRKAAGNAKFEAVPAFVSLLEKSDMPRVNATLAARPNLFGEPRGIQISTNFAMECQKGENAFYNNRFFVVECPQEPVEKQIKAAAMASYLPEFTYLDLFQSERGFKGKKALNGAGSAIIYALMQFSKSAEKNGIFLDSDINAIKFYKKFGFKKRSILNTEMILSEDKFQPAEKEIQKKYSISPVKDIEPYAKDYNAELEGLEFFS